MSHLCASTKGLNNGHNLLRSLTKPAIASCRVVLPRDCHARRLSLPITSNTPSGGNVSALNFPWLTWHVYATRRSLSSYDRCTALPSFSRNKRNYYVKNCVNNMLRTYVLRLVSLLISNKIEYGILLVIW